MTREEKLKQADQTLKRMVLNQELRPIITKIDGQHFSIAWHGNDPVDWAVQTQGAPGGIWDINTTVAGNLREVALTGTPYAARIVGRDVSHNPVTNVSNVLVLNPVMIAPSLDPGEDPPNITLRVSQSSQTNAPEHWKVYSSDTGTGNPDSNPADWSLTETIDGGTASGSDWFAETTADYTGKKVIAQYTVGSNSSLWSDVVTQE